jgi:RNA polymerase sigma factor (sigma-70 family)
MAAGVAGELTRPWETAGNFFQKESPEVKPSRRSRTIQGMGNIESDDRELWSRSLKGDDDAFGLLYDRHYDRVFRHAYRLCGQRHDADDITASSFLELWRLRRKVRLVESSVLPWLLVTTTNVARNNGRAAFRYRRLLNSLPRGVDAPNPSDEVLRDEMDEEAARALGTLNVLDLKLVSLIVFEDYSLAAAAGLLNLTPAAAKSRMHRARQRMQKAISGKPRATPALEGDRS